MVILIPMFSLVSRNIFTFAKLVKVEYCMNWSYQADYERFKDKVLALDPKIKFYGQVTMLSKDLVI